MGHRRLLTLLVGLGVVALFVLGFAGAGRAESRAPAQASGRPKPAKRAKPAKRSPTRRCRPQRPQRFLERPSFVKRGRLDGKAHTRALRYRAEKYGSVPGLGLERYNKERAFSHAKKTTFFGLPILLHEDVVPALGCVERRIQAVCRAPRERYTPKAIGGFRQENTYRQGEVSNHLFGLAIDIDPDRNPCCGCVKPWPDNPICKREAKSAYEQTSLPRCWIDAFERYGFYWLGHDDLKDTMHFEFLGRPERVRR
ncbi:MAG: M15 family metallopeptidase [Sorangiineae bacterium]|nr:M15 family metallopeptidase [Polyangiaceae bacterium]MEB2324211.1 M15 family metallopeptidase [Sorangiineae bacterium]